MMKAAVAGILFCAVAVAASNCREAPADDVEITVSAIGGGSGNQVTSFVRGYTRVLGEHAAVFRYQNGAVMRVTGTPFNRATTLGGNVAPNAAPWGYIRHDNVEAITYVAADRHVHQITTSNAGSAGASGGGTLTDTDFFVQTGGVAPLAAPAPVNGVVPDAIGFKRPDGKDAVVYRSETNHVWMVSSDPGAPQWLAFDLTALTGAPLTANNGGPYPYVRTDNWITIVYIGSDNHIHELANPGAPGPEVGWIDADLSVVTGDLATPNSALWGWKRSDGWNQILFISTDRQLHEFFFHPSHGWGAGLLPAVSPVTGFSRRASGYIRNDGVNAVVYMGSNASVVHELKLKSDGSGWTDVSLPSNDTTNPQGQPFAHLAPAAANGGTSGTTGSGGHAGTGSVIGNRNSVLFEGNLDGLTHGYELGQASSVGAWTLDNIF